MKTTFRISSTGPGGIVNNPLFPFGTFQYKKGSTTIRTILRRENIIPNIRLQKGYSEYSLFHDVKIIHDHSRLCYIFHDVITVRYIISFIHAVSVSKKGNAIEGPPLGVTFANTARTDSPLRPDPHLRKLQMKFSPKQYSPKRGCG